MKKRVFLGLGLWLVLAVSTYAGKSIVVDLSTQTATAYENGIPVFNGHISTGTAKRPTPTGNFRVLEKDIDHVSSSWPKPNGGAKMHYMLRVTGYGIAMHLGFVPNYPASHGCIRLQNGFAQRMYAWAHVGVPVHIIGHAPARVYRQATRIVTPKKKPREKLSALEVFSRASRGRAMRVQTKKAVTPKKEITVVAPKTPSVSKPHRAPSTLDILSTSPKAAKRLKEAQKEKWQRRPEPKSPRVDPLKVLRT